MPAIFEDRALCAGRPILERPIAEHGYHLPSLLRPVADTSSLWPCPVASASHRWRSVRVCELVGLLAFLLMLAGCHSPQPPVYEDHQGFRFVPPPGWVERARDDTLPARLSHPQNLPLPPVGVSGRLQERFLVRYDRISTGQHAWLRITVADLPSSLSLKTCLSTRSPMRHWKRESEEENLEVNGLPAARIAFVGRWYDQDYLCETFAVRKGDRVYLISAAFPASDDKAREQVRQAVFQADWR